MRIVHKIFWRLYIYFELYVICFGKKDAYLRRKGAKIGENCDIGNHIFDFGSEPFLISIGNNVTVTRGSRLITHDGSTRLFRDKFQEMSPFGNLFAPIVVENNCFIGAGSILLPGVHIGENTIVGAGSVVKGKFPPNSVIAGVPAKRLFSLDEYIEKARSNILPITATTHDELKAELLSHFTL